MISQNITFREKYINNIKTIQELIAADKRLNNLMQDQNYISFNFVKVTNFLDVLNYICPEEASKNSSPFIKKSITIQKEVYSHFKNVARKYSGKDQHKEYLDALLSKYEQLKVSKFFIQSNINKYNTFYFLNNDTLKELLEKQTLSNELLIESIKTLNKENKKNQTMPIFTKIMNSFRLAQYNDKFIDELTYERSDIYKINQHEQEIKLLKNILFLRDKLNTSIIEHNLISSYKRDLNKILKLNYNNSIDEYISGEIKPYFSKFESNIIRNKIALYNFKYKLQSNQKEWIDFCNKLNYAQKNNLEAQVEGDTIIIYAQNGRIFMIL
jgi:hypothetical protein